MKVVFLGFSSVYTEGMGYQDNFFLKECVAKGIDTVYLASTECFKNGKIVDCEPEDRFQNDKVHLIRLPYTKIGPPVIYKKLRIIKNVFNILEKEQPDVIFCHNSHYSPILDVVRYKKSHSSVRIFADTHVDEFNSGSNIVSRIILHKCYYKSIIKRLIPVLDKFYYIGPTCKRFLKDMYDVPEDIMEFMPLGGVIIPDDIAQKKRIEVRKKYGIKDDELLFVHSGKLDKLKKTDELIASFEAKPELNAKLLIVGSIPDDREQLLNEMINSDNRIEFLGWKTADELVDILCATDLYCQPGSPSATLQQAICCGCAAMAYPHELYQIINKGNIVFVKTSNDIKGIFDRIVKDKQLLMNLKCKSDVCRREFLDYSLQVDRFTK